MIAAICVTAVAMFVLGGMFYMVVYSTRVAERNRVLQNLEEQTSAKLKKANDIIVQHTDVDAAERELRDGNF